MAYHTLLNSQVALKEFFVKDFCNRDEETGQVTVGTQAKIELYNKLKKKFMDEAHALFNMKHPGIVRVIDYFEENDTAYYAMEYIEGQSLSDLLNDRGPLPEAEAVGYIREVADALKYVHSLNRLHLDIKPGNIMLSKEGNVVLIDFGASKHYDDETGENTSSLLAINTRGYAPIEQVSMSIKSFCPATDIYAVGATLYKLLTGNTPPSSMQLQSKEEKLVPLPSSISPSTRQAVRKAMLLLRKNRPQSVDEWLAILDSTGKKPPVIVEPTPKPTPVNNKIGVSEVETLVDVVDPKPKPKPKPKSKSKPRSKPSPSKDENTDQSFFSKYGHYIVAIIMVLVLHFYESDDIDVTSCWNKATECYKSQEYTEAVEWYRKGAEQGHSNSQYMLGYCYDKGKGVTQDHSEAVKWYRMAAEQGNSHAKKMLEKHSEK